MKNLLFKNACLPDAGKHPPAKGRCLMLWAAIALLLLGKPLTVSSQGYLPLPVENAVWSVSEAKLTMIGDTLINDVSYSKVFIHMYFNQFTPDALEYRCALRQDLSEGKVWVVWKGENQEKLLYDFSLEVGDQTVVTCSKYPKWDAMDQFDLNIEIESIEYVEYDGIMRKKLNLSYGFQEIEYWIEGIGSSYGLIFAGLSYLFIFDVEIPKLICFEVDGEMILQNNSSCYYSSGAGVEESKGESFAINAFPTIFAYGFSISSLYPITSFIVFSSSGQMILAEHLKNASIRHYVSTMAWKPGVYFLQVFAGKHMKVIKIVKS